MIAGRIAYLDCASGAAGDMLLGALVDLGLPVEALQAELAKLPLGGYRIEARKVHRAGLHATKVEVITDEHGEEAVGNQQSAISHGHGGGRGGRGLSDILEIIERSTLDEAVKQRSAALFRRLAEAEGAVHGTPPESVHFHEVGAVDAIVDIVGGVIGLGWLRAERIVASPLNLGTGTVAMAHGVFPVPPPATARLVRGVPVYGSGEGELLTPTGALLVTAHASSYGPMPPLTLEAVGHGAGSRDPRDRPNVLRVFMGEERPAAAAGQKVMVLEAEVDDLSPQLLAPLVERLLAAGALDAFLTPIYMKKGRPGFLITALAESAAREAVEETLFRDTTTLGVRRQEWDRSVLDREVVAVSTAYGQVGIKVGRRGGRVYNAQPEFDDCQRAAGAAGVPVKEVWAAAVAAFRARQ